MALDAVGSSALAVGSCIVVKFVLAVVLPLKASTAVDVAAASVIAVVLMAVALAKTPPLADPSGLFDLLVAVAATAVDLLAVVCDAGVAVGGSIRVGVAVASLPACVVGIPVAISVSFSPVVVPTSICVVVAAAAAELSVTCVAWSSSIAVVIVAALALTVVSTPRSTVAFAVALVSIPRSVVVLAVANTVLVSPVGMMTSVGVGMATAADELLVMSVAGVCCIMLVLAPVMPPLLGMPDVVPFACTPSCRPKSSV